MLPTILQSDYLLSKQYQINFPGGRVAGLTEKKLTQPASRAGAGAGLSLAIFGLWKIIYTYCGINPYKF